MIEFTPEGPVVSFGLHPAAAANSRSRIKFTLDEYLAISKISDSLEELRANLIMFRSSTRKLRKVPLGSRKAAA